MGLLGDFLENTIITKALQASDDSIKKNASAAENAGLEVRVSRTYDGIGLSGDRECQWCKDRECSDVTLAEAYRIGAFQRHPGCGCEIEYTNTRGETRIQNWAGGRESWVREEDVERRKQYGIEPTDGPARHELVKRMLEGRNAPNNGGIIAEKILKKEIRLQQRHQKYLQHIKGTSQYLSATKGRGIKQSYLIISEAEAQDIIYNCAGRGIVRDVTRPEINNCEFITLDKVIGEYFSKGEWHETRRIQLMYSKYGAHIVPVREL